MNKKALRTALLALLLLAMTVVCVYAQDLETDEEAEVTPAEQIDVYASITSSEDSLDAELVYRAELISVAPETAAMAVTVRINPDFSFSPDTLPLVYVDGKELTFLKSDENQYTTESGSCTMQLINPRFDTDTPGYVIINISKTLQSGQNLLVSIPVTLTNIPAQAGSYSYDIGGAAASSLVTYSQTGGTLAGYNFNPLTYNLTVREAVSSDAESQAASDREAVPSDAESQAVSDSGTGKETTSQPDESMADVNASDDANVANDETTAQTPRVEQAEGVSSTQQDVRSANLQNLNANRSAHDYYAVGLSALVMAMAVAMIFLIRYHQTENERKSRSSR